MISSHEDRVERVMRRAEQADCRVDRVMRGRKPSSRCCQRVDRVGIAGSSIAGCACESCYVRMRQRCLNNSLLYTHPVSLSIARAHTTMHTRDLWPAADRISP